MTRTARTIRGQDIVVCTQTQEQEEWNTPDTNGKKGRNVTKRRAKIPAPVRATRPSRCLGLVGKVEEPEKVVGEDKDAARDEGRRGEGDERPCWAYIS